jgi:aromatic ring hydroxylase
VRPRRAGRQRVEHPALREAARSIARLFDIAAAPEMRERLMKCAARPGVNREGRFPNCVFAAVARAKIEELKKKVAAVAKLG